MEGKRYPGRIVALPHPGGGWSGRMQAYGIWKNILERGNTNPMGWRSLPFIRGKELVNWNGKEVIMSRMDYKSDLRFAGIKPFAGKVWLSSPTMHGGEQMYVDEAIRTNWVSTVGENINEVERLTAKKPEGAMR